MLDSNALSMYVCYGRLLLSKLTAVIVVIATCALVYYALLIALHCDLPNNVYCYFSFELIAFKYIYWWILYDIYWWILYDIYRCILYALSYYIIMKFYNIIMSYIYKLLLEHLLLQFVFSL